MKNIEKVKRILDAGHWVNATDNDGVVYTIYAQPEDGWDCGETEQTESFYGGDSSGNRILQIKRIYSILISNFQSVSPKDAKMIVQGYTIGISKDSDYISLTDIAKKFDDLGLIDNWLRNKNTVEFLGVWERMNNPEFNSLEFEGIMKEAGLNRFTLSVKKWKERVNGVDYSQGIGQKDTKAQARGTRYLGTTQRPFSMRGGIPFIVFVHTGTSKSSLYAFQRFANFEKTRTHQFYICELGSRRQ